ncbi:RYamide neuropeptides-like [Aethina tumida]|uniref:RYamide neuropeptides-like n=1 Tax=Aethina tumida TaxID=116153 RepID=UPI00096B0D2C|nr:RYamide neuropeptides-like [Aethina tumida]
MYAKKALVLLLYFLTVFLTFAVAKGYLSDKRAQANSFQTMMRYGRAGSTNNYYKDGKYVKVNPRADAFHLTTRYGKRSSWSPNSSLVYPVSSPCVEDEDLSCTYTGISDLYRCTTRKDSTAGNEEI